MKKSYTTAKDTSTTHKKSNKKKGIPDKDAFKNLNYMEKQHKKIMVEKMKQVILDTVADKPIDGLMQDLKGILVSLNKLKQHYEK